MLKLGFHLSVLSSNQVRMSEMEYCSGIIGLVRQLKSLEISIDLSNSLGPTGRWVAGPACFRGPGGAW